MRKSHGKDLISAAGLLLLGALAACDGNAQERASNFPFRAEGDTVRAWQRCAVEGFAWPTSVLPGDTVNFYVSTIPIGGDGTFDIDIFDAEHVDGTPLITVTNVTGRFYPLHDSTGREIAYGDTVSRPVEYKRGCMAWWQVAQRLVIPWDFSSGLYAARLIHHAKSDYFSWYYIPFVVRAPDPGVATKILFKFEWNTWQAYNWWGGGSLYSGSQHPSLAMTDTIAMDRPLTITSSQSVRYFLKAFATLLRDSGYAMEYCNNIDLDRDPEVGIPLGIDLLSRYQMLVLWNHDEYWSTNERAVIEDPQTGFIAAFHGNLARFAPNTCYWRIHWVEGSAGPHQRLWCQKDNGPTGVAADKWRNLSLPEGEFLGEQYEAGWNAPGDDPVTEQPPARVYTDDHWIFRNTDLKRDSLFGIGVPKGTYQAGILGTELDNTITGRAPFPLDTLAQSYVMSRVDSSTSPPCPCYRPVLHQMVYYEDTSANSRVFASGCGAWFLGFAEDAAVEIDKQRMRTITMNIISHFAGRKYIGRVYTSLSQPLTWQQDVELDGQVEIPAGKYLIVDGPTILVDTTFLIDGVLEIQGSVAMAGPGLVRVWHSGKIRIADGAVLRVGPGITLELADAGDIEFVGNGRLEVEGIVLARDNVNVTIETGSVLRMFPGSTMKFGVAARLTVNGRLSATGKADSSVTFTSALPAPWNGCWYGIVLNGGPDTLAYCTIRYAMDGIEVRNTSTNLVDNCRISHCSYQGVLAYNTTMVAGSLRIQNSVLDSSSRGVALSNARADIDSCTIEGNAWQGIYATNGRAYVTHSTIQSNGYYGLQIRGATGLAVLGTESGDPGYCTVFNNNASQEQSNSEITLSGGATAYIGFYDYDFSYWGYNRVARGENQARWLVDNNSPSMVMAHLTYWGSASGPQPGDFDGPVDYSFWLPAPPGLLSLPMAGEGELDRFRRLAAILEGIVDRGSDSAQSALPMLCSLMGVGGLVSGGDVGALEEYLTGIMNRTQSVPLREMCAGFRIQDRMIRRDYAGVITLAREALDSNPGEDLWLLCESYLVTAYFAGGDLRSASSELMLMSNRATAMDSIAFGILRHMLDGGPLQSAPLPKMQAGTGGSLQGVQRAKPAAFALHQNYPNPFNPLTVIRYELPQDAHTHVKMYDMLGREVAVLVDADMPAGFHTAGFDAARMASGVYLYGIEAGGFTSAKKMIILK